MSNIKRILEVVEADEELKTLHAYARTLRDEEEFDMLMQWIFREALAELEN
jgi:hypothetical protein